MFLCSGRSPGVRMLRTMSMSMSRTGIAHLPPEWPLRRLQDIIENAVAILRHEYDAIRADRLWDIVQIKLPELRLACEAALVHLKKESTRPTDIS